MVQPDGAIAKSPAARGRGLKLDSRLANWGPRRVARRARAWIETQSAVAVTNPKVARRARAWIETWTPISWKWMCSRPPRAGVD